MALGSVGKIFGVIAAIVLVAAVTALLPGIGTLVGSAFLASLIGATIVAVGMAIIQSVFMPKGGQGTDMEAGKVNVKISEPPRWITAGRARQGGAVLFAEFDAAGNLWYLVVHSDSILTNALQYYLDDIPVTLDGSGVVQNPEFRLVGKEKDPASTSGAGTGYVQIWTTTYTESNPTPPAVSALAAAFPSKWTSDHKLVGTTYSVVKISALKIEDRYKIYRWRGPLGLGEPAVAIAGEWSNVYDPRVAAGQTLGDRTTYAPTSNPVLIWAWFRTHRYGRNKSESSINWDKIAEMADICDQSVSGIAGTHTRYECGVAIPENKARVIAEQEIMLTMDAQIVFDDDGKTWVRPGYYYTPTLEITRNRDVIAMESVGAENGESETQGVVVRYTDPTAHYTAQPSAAWYNPLYYVEGEAAQFLTVDILGCQDHNQAMRLAKAIGLRSQPPHKIAPSIGVRGLRARQERIFNLVYDNEFAGDYEVATQVELDGSGLFCGFGAVPVDADRWDLLPGEESPKPVIEDRSTVAAPSLPTSVSITYANGRLVATFTPDTRDDVGYQFQYAPTADVGSDLWRYMTVLDEDGYAYSEPVTQTTEYSIRYRSVSGSGVVSAWSSTSTVDGVSVSDPVAMAIYNSFVLEVSQGIAVVHIASDGTLTIDDHTRRYTDGQTPDRAVTGDVIATGLSPGDIRAIAYDDFTRSGGAVTYNLYEDDTDAHVSDSNPGRHYMGYFEVPVSGTVDGNGGGTFGGGDFCIADYEPVLIANPARNGPNGSIAARALVPGMWVWTRHEDTDEWGAFRVLAVEFEIDDVWGAEGYPDATEGHRFRTDGDWFTMGSIGQPKGVARVARITVKDAHTYVSRGVLSHNVKPLP